MYASSSAEESISHMSQVGDLDSGKAWRAVRRPSDMVCLLSVYIDERLKISCRMSTRVRSKNFVLKRRPERTMARSLSKVTFSNCVFSAIIITYSAYSTSCQGFECTSTSTTNAVHLDTQ